MIYISMGFGNPYGDPYSPEIAAQWSERLANELDIKIISLADTIGVSTPENINHLYTTLIPSLQNVTFGAHLHSNPSTRREKIDAAYQAGCRRIDSAIAGYGGCPMAEDELVGNMATEEVIAYLDEIEVVHGIATDALLEANAMAVNIFP